MTNKTQSKTQGKTPKKMLDKLLEKIHIDINIKPSAAVVIGLLVVVLLCLFVFLPERLKYSVAVNGVVTHEIPVNLLIANTETLVLSPANGSPSYLKPDGSRFRRGEKIADIGKESINAPIAGVFYAAKDGLEGILTPSTLTSMDLQKLLGEMNVIMPEISKLSNNKSVSIPLEKFQPITSTATNGVAGKMVDNLEPSWAFIYMPSETLNKGDSLQFQVGETVKQAVIERVSDNPNGVVVRFLSFLEDSKTQRILPANWIQKKSQQGIIVPVSALIQEGEETSIYVVEGGIIVLKNSIHIIDQNNEIACVEGINAETRVVKNPRPGILGKKAPR